MKPDLTKGHSFSVHALSPATLWHSAQDVLRNPLYANSVYLTANSIICAVLGFAFWMVAARVYSASDVGIGAAAFSTGALLSFVASLGIGSGLVAFLAGAGQRKTALINSCMTISASIAVVVAVVFLAGIPLWSPALKLLSQTPLHAIGFVGFVVAGTLFGLMDDVFVAMRRAEYTMAKNLLGGLLRLGLVVVLASYLGGFGIFASWGLAALAGVVVSAVLFLPAVLSGYRTALVLRFPLGKGIMRFSLANYLTTGLWNAPGWLLPLVVVNRLGSETNAYFYVCWGIAGLLFAIPLATSTSLFAEGSYQEHDLQGNLRRVFRLTAWLLLPAMAGMAVFGDKLLLMFGDQYSVQARNVLLVLTASALPVATNAIYLAVARVRRQLGRLVLVASGMAGATLLLSVALIPSLGIIGPALAWAVSQLLMAMLVLPEIVSVLRGKSKCV